jgi:hypothetical protein
MNTPTLRHAAGALRVARVPTVPGLPGFVRVAYVAARLRCSERWARLKYVGPWFDLQERRPGLPRVRVVRNGLKGRPFYAIDLDSFNRWMMPHAIPAL